MNSVGWIGLGSIGHVMAANIEPGGYDYIAADPVNADAAPESARASVDNGEVARHAETVFLSLPDGEISVAVCQELVDEPNRIVKRVVNTSTTGLDLARHAADLLATAGIGYVDSPVSGGIAGARAKTLALMVSGSGNDIDRSMHFLEMLGNVTIVGEAPGQAQALKLLNNFLAATALVATSEAVAFGVKVGLDITTIIDVVNAASGRNTATLIKFPQEIITDRYHGGFSTDLFAKDLRLYTESVEKAGTPDVIGSTVKQMWMQMSEDAPGSDSTRIYPYIQHLPTKAQS